MAPSLRIGELGFVFHGFQISHIIHSVEIFDSIDTSTASPMFNTYQNMCDDFDMNANNWRIFTRSF